MEKRNLAEVERELMSHLSASELSKEHLASVSKSIASFYNSGLKIVDWWIYGIPAFERIVIQTQLPISELNVVHGLLENDRFKEMHVFRKGIPKPEFFRVDLTIEKIAQPR